MTQEQAVGSIGRQIGANFFERYGIPTVMIRTYPAVSHLAEKLHAYTMPRLQENTRVKDLIDMPLLGSVLDGHLSRDLLGAFRLTFESRGTHALPTRLPAPPKLWLDPYDRLYNDEGLPWRDLEELHAAAAALIDPVLTGRLGRWSNERRVWT